MPSPRLARRREPGENKWQEPEGQAPKARMGGGGAEIRETHGGRSQGTQP